MMEAEINKMKDEYEFKIQDCDEIISSYRKKIAANRKSGNDEESEHLRKDRAIEQAKRQAYVQAKYDFDSLLDYI